MKRGWLGIAVLLAGCATAPSWIKPGADVGETASAYQSCRAIAAAAVETEADIDQDILATRGSDLQRAGSYRVAAQDMQDHTKDRAARILSSCMAAKGFAEAR
jgi:hypothetical protein